MMLTYTTVSMLLQSFYGPAVVLEVSQNVLNGNSVHTFFLFPINISHSWFTWVRVYTHSFPRCHYSFCSPVLNRIFGICIWRSVGI